MIDLTKIDYHVVVLDEIGVWHNISEFIQNFGWEENENEISARFSFTARNDPVSAGRLSELIKPGCPVCVTVSDGNMPWQEVMRGYVETWKTSRQSGSDDLACIGYDSLYKLQKSQDNFYFPSGTGTKAAVMSVLEEWEIPFGIYEGPDATHGKLVFNNRYLSDILLELLDDARKKGERKCILRASEGMVNIIPRGSNKTIYVFSEDNVKSFSESVSTENLITRVKVVGKEKKDKTQVVEAVVDGYTQYGIRQKIYKRGSDESLDDAKKAAQEILNNEGGIKREIRVEGPDLPFVRKGDLIYILNGASPGNHYVKGVRHNADTYSMSMDLEPANIPEQEEMETEKSYEVGDIVDFHGGTHYVSSYPDARGYSARAGKAKITIKNGLGKAHPWHLIHVDNESNVYGWVDDGTFD